uniref:Uncharacterized protein n=1 Tax=Plectus sambesii TaxID=2011161 RepID=A0A914VEU5_9BILA
MKEIGRSVLFPPNERSSSSSSTANHQLVTLPRPPPPVIIRQPMADHIYSVSRTPAVSTAVVGRRLAASSTPSSIRTRPTRSVSPPTQELVSLDNPRPTILRGSNDYTDVNRHATEAGDQRARGISRQHRNVSSPGPLSWTNSSNFDRPKVHHTNSNGSAKQLGEIKPLVRTADCLSKAPPLPTSRMQ